MCMYQEAGQNFEEKNIALEDSTTIYYDNVTEIPGADLSSLSTLGLVGIGKPYLIPARGVVSSYVSPGQFVELNIRYIDSYGELDRDDLVDNKYGYIGEYNCIDFDQDLLIWTYKGSFSPSFEGDIRLVVDFKKDIKVVKDEGEDIYRLVAE